MENSLIQIVAAVVMLIVAAALVFSGRRYQVRTSEQRLRRMIETTGLDPEISMSVNHLIRDLKERLRSIFGLHSMPLSSIPAPFARSTPASANIVAAVRRITSRVVSLDDRVLVVEQSHGRQFHRYLRSYYDIDAEVKCLSRPGPLLITPGEVVRQIEEWE